MYETPLKQLIVVLHLFFALFKPTRNNVLIISEPKYVLVEGGGEAISMLNSQRKRCFIIYISAVLSLPVSLCE